MTVSQSLPLSRVVISLTTCQRGLAVIVIPLLPIAVVIGAIGLPWVGRAKVNFSSVVAPRPSSPLHSVLFSQFR